MSDKQAIPTLQRPAFFDGQRLTADDLGAVHSYHRELRWLHNRSLHNWGLAFGYAVSGARGARTVTVQPGYALDCEGRDLILSETTEMAIPPVGGDDDGNPVSYYLTVSYADDEDLTPETRQGTCGTGGAVRRPEKPILRWQSPNERSGEGAFRHGLDVVLASVEVQNCQLVEAVSTAERRDALPAEQPYVAAGQTVAGQTGWSFWPEEGVAGGTSSTGITFIVAPPPRRYLAVTTTVATTEAGFRTTPTYFARVAGSRHFTFTQPNPEGDDLEIPLVVDGYAQVTNPTPFSFDLRVYLPAGQIFEVPLNPPGVIFADAFLGRLRSNVEEEGGLGWHVVWMGIGN